MFKCEWLVFSSFFILAYLIWPHKTHSYRTRSSTPETRAPPLATPLQQIHQRIVLLQRSREHDDVRAMHCGNVQLEHHVVVLKPYQELRQVHDPVRTCRSNSGQNIVCQQIWIYVNLPVDGMFVFHCRL